LITALGSAGLCLIPATALAQAQKAEVPEADAPFKPAPRRKPTLDDLINSNDRVLRFCLLAEYRFINKICILTPKQSKAIAREGEQAFRRICFDMAKRSEEAAAAGESLPTRDLNQIRGVIWVEMNRIATKHLTAEQSNRLHIEDERRTAMRRKLAIEALVTIIDHELILTEDQRDKIRRSLDANWQENWLSLPEYLLLGSPKPREIPDEYIVKFLTENQRTAWREMPKDPIKPTMDGLVKRLLAGDQALELEDDQSREAREAETQVREDARRRKAQETAR
jgi:hypothetical protein